MLSPEGIGGGRYSSGRLIRQFPKAETESDLLCCFRRSPIVPMAKFRTKPESNLLSITAKAKKLIWGVGPSFLLPTATDDVLGQKKCSIGPSVVLLTQPGHWTIGALINNIWSFAGSGNSLPFPSQLLPCGECTQPIGISTHKDVNQMLLQYFINYNLKKHFYITWQPIITANWEASSGNVWTVPFG